MLHWFEVTNFKSIHELHLEIRPFMVLVGANATGKTNIVQALSVFLDILAQGDTTPLDLQGGFEQLLYRRGSRRAIGLGFALRSDVGLRVSSSRRHSSVVEVSITLRADEDGGASTEREEVRLIDEGKPFVATWTEESGFSVRQGSSESTRRWIQHRFGDRGRLREELVRRAEHQTAKQLHAPFPDGARRKLARRLKLLPLFEELDLPSVQRLRLDATSLRSDAPLQVWSPGQALSAEGKGLPLAIRWMKSHGIFKHEWEHVLARLQEIYPRIEDVRLVRPQPGHIALTFKERGLSSDLKDTNTSDGVIHALALLVALHGPFSRGILAIEEPENALHPWALRSILADAQDEHRFAPLLLTTHSPVLVDAVRDPASLLIVEREGHETTVTPAVEKEHALRMILAETGQKLGEIWLGGALGGVPGAGA
jgi:predicted ATPase